MATGADALRRMFEEIAAAMEAEKDELCRLDGVIGDADHGIAMALGFGAVREALAGLGPEADPSAVMNAAAKAFLNAVGASCGPLYATAFMRAGAAVKGKAALEDADVVAMLQAMAKGIADRGKAAPGEKTMLDAWAPAAEAAGATRRGPGGTARRRGRGGGGGRGGDEGHGREQGPLRPPRRAGARACRSRRGLGRGADPGDAAGLAGVFNLKLP